MPSALVGSVCAFFGLFKEREYSPLPSAPPSPRKSLQANLHLDSVLHRPKRHELKGRSTTLT